MWSHKKYNRQDSPASAYNWQMFISCLVTVVLQYAGNVQVMRNLAIYSH